MTKRAVILEALQAHPHLSAKQLAGELGLGQSYISRIRKQVMHTLGLPDRVQGADGKTYPSTLSKKRPAVSELLV